MVWSILQLCDPQIQMRSMGILVPRLKSAREFGDVCFPASVHVEAWHCAMRCLQIRACLWALPSHGILRFLGQSSCDSHRIIYLGRDFWRSPGASQSRISFEAAQGCAGPPDFLQAGIKMESLLQAGTDQLSSGREVKPFTHPKRAGCSPWSLQKVVSRLGWR